MSRSSPEPAVRIAAVAVEGALYHFDRAFSYRVPQPLWDAAKPGCRVTVPFGKGNRMRTGMLLSVEPAQVLPEAEMKEIAAVLDQAPLLSLELLRLAEWMRERYFCTLYDAVRVLLPAGFRVQVRREISAAKGMDVPATLPPAQKQILQTLARKRKPAPLTDVLAAACANFEDARALSEQGLVHITDGAARKVADAVNRMVRVRTDWEETPLPKKQECVYRFLCETGAVSQKELCYYTGVTPGVVVALAEKGAVECFDTETFRNPYADVEPDETPQKICLSPEQEGAFRQISGLLEKEEGGAALLYGVTGSGKTSVYLRLVDQVYAQGRGVIVMVPEISLTPQVVALFHKRYGKGVAVFHSGLSLGERLDEWKRVKNGSAKIAVGTRSAVFAPFDDIGLIVMDEEQEYTYKSESAPRFHAREVARFRCAYHKAVLLLSSATPSIESRYAAERGLYTFARISSRYGGAVLPEVSVVDMNEERLGGNRSVFSEQLLSALRENTAQGRQSILLLNRRGYRTLAICRACREVVTCPHCSISLTYHAANGRLVCHYCGYSVPVTEVCPHCHEPKVDYLGAGTQRAEEELTSLLPDVRVLRIDTDSAMTRASYETYMQAFSGGKYDILVGTQMVAKGLDFPNVTLVGVLSADQALYSDDFRSTERAFDLLTQVVGRSGRGNLRGEAIIQTFTPENPVIQMAARQDYETFYAGELQFRKAMLYPPFADFCVAGFSGTQEALVREAAFAFLESLREAADRQEPKLPIRVLAPSAALVSKVSNKYRYRLIVKCRNNRAFRTMMAELLRAFQRRREYAEVSVFLDINPDRVL